MPGLWRICVPLGVLATAALARPIAFNRSIRPILSDHCFTSMGLMPPIAKLTSAWISQTERTA
jgi:hypothetical protein